MKKQTALVIASIFVVASVFTAGYALANEEGSHSMNMSSSTQCSGQMDRDVSYSNPDYSFN